ncbi:MAG: protein kinase [Elusimicrobiota bacterium]|jgi:tetratricopeptide (TPR) repeat protein
MMLSRAFSILLMPAVFVLVFSGSKCDKDKESSSHHGGSHNDGGGTSSKPPSGGWQLPTPTPVPMPKPNTEDSTRLIPPQPATNTAPRGGGESAGGPAVTQKPKPEETLIAQKPYVPPPEISDTPPPVSAPRYRTLVGIPEINGTAAEFAKKGGAGTGSKGLRPVDDEIDASGLNASVSAPSGEAAMEAALRHGALSENARVQEIMSIEAAADPVAQSQEFQRSALLKMKMMDFKGALKDATRAIALDPKNPDAYLVRARTYARMKDYSSAEADALSAIGISPNHAEGWHTVAWSQMQQGKFKDALNSINRAIQLDPDNASNFAMRAMIREKLGDRSGALDDMKRASRLDSRYKDIYRNAKNGGSIFESLQDDALSLLDEVSSGGNRPVAPSLYGALALFMGSLGWGLWAFLRRKEKDEDASFRSKMAALREPEAVDDGKIAGKYEVLRMIGRGGMGQVFVARDLSLGREVAVKRIAEAYAKLDARAKERVLAEAKTVASLHHPGIVDIYEVIERGSELFLVFELVSGKTVSQLLAEEKRLTPQRALEVLRPICQALDFAHGKGVVHRDLKPANIMVTTAGYIKLMDFGIAHSTAKPPPAVLATAPPGAADKLFVSHTANLTGTPAYMPPEAERGEVRPAFDVYSLGACLYEMLTGAAPFPHPVKLTDKLDMRFQPPSVRVQGLSESFDKLVSEALQADPEKRMKSASEFLSRLEAAVSGKA